MPDPIGKRILALLADERAAIRNADFAQLDALADTKEELFAALQTGKPNTSELAAIKSYLDTNQTLLDAAIKGVAEALERLSAVRSVSEGLSFYDQLGKMSQVQTRRPDLEKKA